jgi:hypothetical protein
MLYSGVGLNIPLHSSEVEEQLLSELIFSLYIYIYIYIITNFRIILYHNVKPSDHWHNIEDSLLTGLLPSQIFNDLGVNFYYKFVTRILSIHCNFMCESYKRSQTNILKSGEMNRAFIPNNEQMFSLIYVFFYFFYVKFYISFVFLCNILKFVCNVLDIFCFCLMFYISFM